MQSIAQYKLVKINFAPDIEKVWISHRAGILNLKKHFLRPILQAKRIAKIDCYVFRPRALKTHFPVDSIISTRILKASSAALGSSGSVVTKCLVCRIESPTHETGTPGRILTCNRDVRSVAL